MTSVADVAARSHYRSGMYRVDPDFTSEPDRRSRAQADADDLVAAEHIERLRSGSAEARADARAGLAAIFARRGQFDLVVELLEANLALGRDDPADLRRLRAAYRALGRDDEAATVALRASLAANPTRFEPRLQDDAPTRIFQEPYSPAAGAPTSGAPREVSTLLTGMGASTGMGTSSSSGGRERDAHPLPDETRPLPLWPTPDSHAVPDSRTASLPASERSERAARPDSAGTTRVGRAGRQAQYRRPVRAEQRSSRLALAVAAGVVVAALGVAMLVRASIAGYPFTATGEAFPPTPSVQVAGESVPTIQAGAPSEARSASSTVGAPREPSEPREPVAPTQSAPAAAAKPAPAPALPATVATPAPAPTVQATALPSPMAASLEDAAERAKAFTALVVTDSGVGSAFAVGADRFITNYHVIEGAQAVKVRLSDNRVLTATVVQYDERRDLAMLNVANSTAPPAEIRDARELRPAETLLAIGFPHATLLRPSEASVARGIHSARWQSPWEVWHVQTDAPVNPGNSGGPLVDTQGRVVGLVTMSLRGAVGLNYAVASDELTSFMQGRGAIATAPPTVQVASPGQAPAPGQAPVQGARPQLGDVKVTSPPVPPNGSATLSFDVTNPNTGPIKVALGASIRLGSGAWISDPSNDRVVIVPPGQSTQTRQFRIPAAAARGVYDVWGSLLSEDLKGSFGQSVLPAALTVGAAPAAPPPAPAQPAPATTAPSAPSPKPSAAEDAVRRYYRAVGAGDHQAAWALMSPRSKAGGYDAWVTRFRTTTAIEVTSASTVAQTGASATVQVTFVSTDRENGRVVTRTFSGTWQLVNSGGAWLLDESSMRQAN